MWSHKGNKDWDMQRSVQSVCPVVPNGQYNSLEGNETKVHTQCCRGGQLDELWEPHFRKKLTQEPGVSGTKLLFIIWWLLISLDPTTVGMSLLCLDSRFKPFTVSLLCVSSTWILLPNGNVGELHKWRVRAACGSRAAFCYTYIIMLLLFFAHTNVL